MAFSLRDFPFSRDQEEASATGTAAGDKNSKFMKNLRWDETKQYQPGNFLESIDFETFRSAWEGSEILHLSMMQTRQHKLFESELYAQLIPIPKPKLSKIGRLGLRSKAI